MPKQPLLLFPSTLNNLFPAKLFCLVHDMASKLYQTRRDVPVTVTVSKIKIGENEKEIQIKNFNI